MPARSGLLMVAALLLPGCHSYHQDLDTICHVWERSGADPKDGLASVAPWLSEHIHTDRARNLFREAAEEGSIHQFDAKLRQEAAAEGIEPCPFADRIARL